jgi:hypothetical protein
MTRAVRKLPIGGNYAVRPGCWLDSAYACFQVVFICREDRRHALIARPHYA